jgi:hypothetical protein
MATAYDGEILRRGRESMMIDLGMLTHVFHKVDGRIWLGDLGLVADLCIRVL